MLIHVRRKLIFCLHATAASRLWERILLARDFQIIGSRHEGPRSITTYIETPQMRAWWESDPSEYDYAYMVRHHGDSILSWWTKFKHIIDGANQEKVCPIFVQEFPKTFARLYPSSRRFWRFVWEVPNAEVYFFENLKNDMWGYLATHDLPPLQSDEFYRAEQHRTEGKPEGDWKNHWTPEGLRLASTLYRKELTLLGYRL